MNPVRATARKVGIRSLLFFSYLLAGAGVFLAIEKNEDYSEVRKVNLDKISKLLEHYNFTKEDSNDLRTFYNVMVHAEISTNSGHASKWTFVHAFAFCGNMVATIGYGKLAPATIAGRIVCMFYAIFGIPLTGFFLRTVGNELTSLIAYLIKLYERRMFNREVERLEIKCAIVASLLALAILFAGGVIFSLSENWTYLEAFYFCFITLTTIGFGDLVPGQNRSSDFRQEIELFIEMAFLIYYVIGLSIMSGVILSISTLIEEKTKRFDMGDPMDAIKNIRIENLNSKALKKLGYRVEDDIGIPGKPGDRRGAIVPDDTVHFRKLDNTIMKNPDRNGGIANPQEIARLNALPLSPQTTYGYENHACDDLGILRTIEEDVSHERSLKAEGKNSKVTGEGETSSAEYLKSLTQKSITAENVTTNCVQSDARLKRMNSRRMRPRAFHAVPSPPGQAKVLTEDCNANRTAVGLYLDTERQSRKKFSESGTTKSAKIEDNDIKRDDGTLTYTSMIGLPSELFATSIRYAVRPIADHLELNGSLARRSDPSVLS